MHIRRPASPRAIGLVISMAILLAVPSVAAVEGAGATPAASPALQEWAYGAARTVNGSGATPNGSYVAHAFFGYHVILTQTNTSSSTYLLELKRTMASNITVTYCDPDCAAPLATSTLSLRAMEVDTGFANVTTQASVTVNGTSVPATGIIDSSATVTGFVDDSYSAVLHGVLVNHVGSGALEINESAHLAIAFQPALGLVPDHLYSGEAWNSTSQYTAVGGWAANYSHLRDLVNGTGLQGSSTYAESANGSGHVLLAAVDLGHVTLVDGAQLPTLALTLAGPFHLREGFFFLPGDSDLFATGPTPWAASSFGGPQAQLAQLDLAPDSGAHLGLLASSTSFASSSMSPATSVGMMSPATSGSGGTAPILVQGQPETVPAAQQGSQCLTVGSCTSTTPQGGSPSPSNRLNSIAALVIVIAAVAVVSAVMVSRRRTIVPPPPATATLYPPGADLPPSPHGGRTPSGPAARAGPTAAADDPLDHLW
ncbi:MAG: hypothetical protein ACREDK_04070 [Thermoplasmata archaeon]